jgi:hypothetical protein
MVGKREGEDAGVDNSLTNRLGPNRQAHQKQDTKKGPRRQEAGIRSAGLMVNRRGYRILFSNRSGKGPGARSSIGLISDSRHPLKLRHVDGSILIPLASQRP